MELVEIENRIKVCDELNRNASDYLDGINKDVIVCVRYHNVKTCKYYPPKKKWTFQAALDIVRKQRNDKSFKNFEFLIEL